jgi:transposase-like protein
MSIEKTLLLTYAFPTQMSYKMAIRESSIEDQSTSDATIASRYSLCREICMIALEHRNESEGKIGGEGRVVEIDECKIGRRKFNEGRIIDGNWILGMIDLDGGYRLKVCPENKRDKTTLRDLIIKNVASESTIMTDCWMGYEGLNEIRFQHLTVNHNYNYVDPETWANTQRIESSWRPLRKRLSRGGITKDKLASHLCEYVWRKEVVNNKKDPFEVMLDDIRNVYQMN